MTELVCGEFAEEFFAPASSDMVDGLIGQYRNMRAKVEQVAEMMQGEIAGAVSYFIEGNQDQHARYAPAVQKLFCLDGAIASLNAAYWSKTLALTDVLDLMPQARRDEWHKSIREMTTPEFTEDAVRPTLSNLLNMRSQFLAERVDGIFRGLSGEHVTNAPQAFGKRMIVANVLNDMWSSNHGKCGLINDLRAVVAKFMGRDEPGYSASQGLIDALKGRWGEWVPVDGGALKIRLYRKGTAHIEIHPDMAWRLNSILAHLYPMAIAAEYRQKPKRKPKEIDLIQRPLPFAVVDLLAQMKPATKAVASGDWRHPYRHEKIDNALQWAHHGAKDKHVLAEACAALESIGGVSVDGRWQFDYSPGDIVAGIVASGCIPDDKAHQFYPTPDSLAARVVELAEIEPGDSCLEPSAGTGAIADLMPRGQTRCVEVSRLRCDVLAAKGFANVACWDFLAWSAEQLPASYSRICMNPPFDRSQWKAHLEAASGLVKAGGRLVAILPASARNSAELAGFDLAWHGPFDNQFPGASVSVVILVAQK